MKHVLLLITAILLLVLLFNLSCERKDKEQERYIWIYRGNINDIEYAQGNFSMCSKYKIVTTQGYVYLLDAVDFYGKIGSNVRVSSNEKYLCIDKKYYYKKGSYFFWREEQVASLEFVLESTK